MELHFLGTGAGVPSIDRNVSALALRFLEKGGETWLFDCGEATQHQLLHSALSLSDITRIFITHIHGDHILGLPGLLSSRSFQGAKDELVIYGPPGIEDFVDVSLRVSQTTLRYRLSFVELEPGPLLELEDKTVDVLRLNHPVPSFAFKVTEADKPGALQVEKLKAEGVPPGPLYKELKSGKTVILADGRELNGKDYLGETMKGRVVVIAGDTKPVSALVPFAKGCDVLIHEATFASDKQEVAHGYGHSTIADICDLADLAEVRQLLLTHVSSRYARDSRPYMQEVKQRRPGTIVAEDLMVYELAKPRAPESSS
ncbi:ribonuclease Z [Shouchella shacheensis]|uniref:ribonuclease Z n=1 Tax=Shouchella shacheensis TaxID=1649580 RepID=UPI000740183F|nr:ribonuclease Z [Shouchella shacheensis]